MASLNQDLGTLFHKVGNKTCYDVGEHFESHLNRQHHTILKGKPGSIFEGYSFGNEYAFKNGLFRYRCCSKNSTKETSHCNMMIFLSNDKMKFAFSKNEHQCRGKPIQAGNEELSLSRITENKQASVSIQSPTMLSLVGTSRQYPEEVKANQSLQDNCSPNISAIEKQAVQVNRVPVELGADIDNGFNFSNEAYNPHFNEFDLMHSPSRIPMTAEFPNMFTKDHRTFTLPSLNDSNSSKYNQFGFAPLSRKNQLFNSKKSANASAGDSHSKSISGQDWQTLLGIRNIEEEIQVMNALKHARDLLIKGGSRKDQVKAGKALETIVISKFPFHDGKPQLEIKKGNHMQQIRQYEPPFDNGEGNADEGHLTAEDLHKGNTNEIEEQLPNVNQVNVAASTNDKTYTEHSDHEGRVSVLEISPQQPVRAIEEEVKVPIQESIAQSDASPSHTQNQLIELTSEESDVAVVKPRPIESARVSWQEPHFEEQEGAPKQKSKEDIKGLMKFKKHLQLHWNLQKFIKGAIQITKGDNVLRNMKTLATFILKRADFTDLMQSKSQFLTAVNVVYRVLKDVVNKAINEAGKPNIWVSGGFNCIYYELEGRIKHKVFNIEEAQKLQARLLTLKNAWRSSVPDHGSNAYEQDLVIDN